MIETEIPPTQPTTQQPDAPALSPKAHTVETTPLGQTPATPLFEPVLEKIGFLAGGDSAHARLHDSLTKGADINPMWRNALQKKVDIYISGGGTFSPDEEGQLQRAGVILPKKTT